MTPPIVKSMADPSVRLMVSPPPHWRSGRTIQKMMLEHLLALVPAFAMGISMFGVHAAAVVCLAGIAAVVAEAVCLKLQNRDMNVDDFTALYAGVLFAFLLPATAPWWLVVIGAVLTIVLGRTVFGGFGCNPVCAPLVAWALCRLSWPAAMDFDLNLSHFLINYPLDQLKHFGVGTLDQFDYKSLFLGRQLGGLGACQVLGVLIGGIYLCVRGWISPYIAVTFLIGVAGTSAIFWGIAPDAYANPLFHLLTGSTVFGAFFLATDSSSSPVGRIPQIIFGLLAGAMVMIIRVYGVYSDGVPLAILLVNLLTPLLDRIRPKPFGGR